MAIRPANAADLPALIALERSTSEAAHWSAEQYEIALSGASAPRVFLVFEDESRLEGFLVARCAEFEWELENLAVALGHRRLGIGRGLLDALIDSARAASAEAIFLEVRASNVAARALYEKSGFIHNGTRPRYYREPDEDAAIYCLSFV